MENAIVFGANDESADYADFTDLRKTESQNCTRSTKEILIKNTCLYCAVLCLLCFLWLMSFCEICVICG
jgi:hypothetical protein